MTYTSHRNTQETLQILDDIDLDSGHISEEELYKRFGLEERYNSGQLTAWEKFKPNAWTLFDEPYSSCAAKVSTGNLLI
ncbi:unnamed protein product [Protopolystoma xenopodis]|uniref:Uncharacterized protein n=1 Tax=Protopolystoma xenopodis TaxID=117903 RepID=A0A3S5FDC9_9PLAT|nr:unnamed protein product [Protopolystoma xenopodis]